jgi:predicted amidophosphoribosyltransferase
MNGIKEWIKGYNHTSQIAKDCFSDTNIKILPFALQKKFIFKKQAGSSKKERLANMAGVFYLDTKHRLTGANVLLLDDVMTTGATINECTKVLFEAGVKNVFVLTFAKSIADEEMLKNMEEDSI